MSKFKGLGVGIANAFDNIDIAIALIYDIFDGKKVMMGSITLILGGFGYLIPFTLLLIVVIYNIITGVFVKK